jgi:hypothetical protein
MTTSLIIFTAFTVFALLLFNAIVVYRVWLQVDNLEWNSRYIKGTVEYLQKLAEDTNRRTIEMQQGVTHPSDDLLVDKLTQDIEAKVKDALRDEERTCWLDRGGDR